MYFLLAQLSLQKMTEGFVQKYTEVNVQMAHNALLYFDDFNKQEKINFLGKEISFKEMASRLKSAVTNSSQISKPDQAKALLPKKINPILDDTPKRKYISTKSFNQLPLYKMA